MFHNSKTGRSSTATLLLRSFFHPPVTSWRGLQQTTPVAQVHTQCGMRRTSLGARSDAASVFDAALWPQVLTALRPQLRPHVTGAEQAALAALTAVDGSLLPALPRIGQRFGSGGWLKRSMNGIGAGCLIWNGSSGRMKLPRNVRRR